MSAARLAAVLALAPLLPANPNRRRLRGGDLPSKRPTSWQRAEIAMHSAEWDVAARRGRNRAKAPDPPLRGRYAEGGGYRKPGRPGRKDMP